jgi:HlyD family secretion protein
MKKRFVIAGAILIIVVIALLLLKKINKNHDDGVLIVSGNVEVTEVNMGFKIPGRVMGLLTDEGRKVNAGDKLAVLDDAELQSQVAQNRAYLSEAVAKLEELKIGSRPQEIQQAMATVDQAEAERHKAEKDHLRAEALFRKEVVSAQYLDTAKKAYDIAVAQHKKALEALSLVREGPRKEVIKASGDRVLQAKAALQLSIERLNDSIIYAPASGVVLQKNVEPGETVASGLPVFTIGDLANPWIKVYIKEDKLGLIKLGQKAEITTDSYPGKKYEGTVTYISSEAEFTPKNVQTQEERVKLVFGVKVSVQNLNDELKPGMPADVKIVLK